MRLLCLAKGYASYGASILTAASEHLELAFKDIEPINLAIEVTAYIAHDGPPRRSLEALLEEHIARFPKQVRAQYRAKVGKLNVEYPSDLREAESFGRPGGIYAVAHVFPRALDELSGAVVEGLRSKPAIWSKIDVARLNEAIEKSKAALPASPGQISHYMRQMDEARAVSLKAPVSIDDLDIEWSRYHPASREILDAPFFWSAIDDDAPHGNDTGSDLLAAFQHWNRRNPTTSCEGYVDRLLRRWGVIAEQARGRLDELHLDSIRHEADIALAFAAIKLRGACEDREARAAINAIEKRIEQLRESPDRTAKFLLLRDALKKYVERS